MLIFAAEKEIITNNIIMKTMILFQNICTQRKAMIAFLFTVVMTMTTLTSCSNQDTPVVPPVVDKTLTGDWLYEYSYNDDDETVGKYVSYTLISFDENGVITQRVYHGNTGISINHWERWRRHGMYSVDETAHTITIEGISDEPQVIGYTLTDGKLMMRIFNEIEKNYQTATLRRPETADMTLLGMVDVSVRADDYVGKWLSYTNWEDIGIRLYVMVEFTEEGVLNVRRYSVDTHNECMRTVFSQYYEDCEEEEGDDMKMIKMHDSKDFSKTYLYWWSIENNNLIMGEPEDPDFDTTYHPLTPADVVLLEELDKMVKE